MDWTELRRASRRDAEQDAPGEERIAAMRRALDRRMAEESPGRSPTRRRPRRLVPTVGLLGIGAASVVTLLVVMLGPAPTASAEVSATLRAAATAVAAREGHDADILVVYQRAVTDGRGTLLLGGSYVQRRTGGWDWERQVQPERVLDAWGPSGAAMAAQARKEIAATGTSVLRSDRDRYFWDIWGPVFTPASVRALPRSPDALLERLQGTSTNPERGMDSAAALLESGLADEELQAVVYRALVRIPGLTLERHAEDIDGRPGAGIGLLVSGGQQRVTLIIDPASGRYLGQTETNVAGSDGAPAGTVVRAPAVHPR